MDDPDFPPGFLQLIQLKKTLKATTCTKNIGIIIWSNTFLVKNILAFCNLNCHISMKTMYYLEPFFLLLMIGPDACFGSFATAGAKGVHSGICVTQVSACRLYSLIWKAFMPRVSRRDGK